MKRLPILLALLLVSVGLTQSTRLSLSQLSTTGATAGRAITYNGTSASWGNPAPTAHKATHAAGGADVLTPADVGALALSGDTMQGDLAMGTDANYFFLRAANDLDYAFRWAGTGAPFDSLTPDGPLFTGRGGGVFGTRQGSGATASWQLKWTPTGVDVKNALSVGGGATVGGQAVVVTNDARLSDARAPLAHDASLITSGTVDYARLPVAPSGSFNLNQVVSATDSRLSNARTPTAHAGTHASASSDPLTPASIGAAGLGSANTYTSTNTFNDFITGRKDLRLNRASGDATAYYGVNWFDNGVDKVGIYYEYPSNRLAIKYGTTNVATVNSVGDAAFSGALTSGGTAVSLSGHSHDASALTTGTVTPARLGSGSATASTVLYGDNTWKTPPAGGGGALPGQQRLYHFNDFVTPTSNNYWTQSVSGTGANVTSINNSTLNRLGIVRLSSGTTATGRVHIGTPSSPLRLGIGTARLDFDLSVPTLSTAAETFTGRVGFLDSVSVESSNGCFFRYSHGLNAGRWQAVCRNNGVETGSVVDTGVAVAAGTWVNMEVIVNAAGTAAEFKINNAVVATITTNIPTTGRNVGYGVFGLKSVGTVSTAMFDVDFGEIEVVLTTSR